MSKHLVVLLVFDRCKMVAADDPAMDACISRALEVVLTCDGPNRVLAAVLGATLGGATRAVTVAVAAASIRAERGSIDKMTPDDEFIGKAVDNQEAKTVLTS